MELRVRKLKESDWDYIPGWYEKYKQTAPARDFFPGAFPVDGEQEKKREGLGGFVVCKGDHPVAAMWLWLTNSKTAIPAVVISDRDYKDTDRSDALQLLVDFTTDFAEQMGFKYAFAWAKQGILLEKYVEAGYHKDDTPSYELICEY